MIDRNTIELLIECGIKLGSKSETVASACVFLHQFARSFDSRKYDDVLMAATSVYLAAKVEEDHVRIRDVINVFHAATHKGSDPLACDERYWGLRDSIVHCELLLLRMLRFKVRVIHYFFIDIFFIRVYCVLRFV